MDFPHDLYLYIPAPLLGTETITWQTPIFVDSPLQHVPASLLAEPSLWPDALLTLPTTPKLNELHTTLFIHVSHLHLSL